MKRLIILTLCLLSATRIYASNFDNKIKYDATINLGMNCTNPAFVFAARIGFEYRYLRAGIDIGKTKINHPLCEEGFTTVCPSIGLHYGNKVKVFLMIGAQTYGFINHQKNPNYFRSDHIYGLARIGIQHFVAKNLFLNYEVNHLFHDKKNGTQHFSNTNVCIGVGYAF